MDDEKLDILLNELKRTQSSVDFNEFCNSQWGQSKETFKTARLLADKLVLDEHAEFTLNNPKLIIIVSKGLSFNGYVQKSLDDKIKQDGLDELSKLTRDNLLLQNESLKYQQTIREQQEKIATLTEKNLSLQNRQLRRYIIYSIIGAISALILSNLKEVCQYLQTHIQ